MNVTEIGSLRPAIMDCQHRYPALLVNEPCSQVKVGKSLLLSYTYVAPTSLAPIAVRTVTGRKSERILGRVPWGFCSD